MSAAAKDGRLFTGSWRHVEFDAAYGVHIDAVGVPAIERRFRDISDRRGSPLVLLCFEADPADCHRSTFGRWWLDRTGEAVPEYQSAH
jgi:hypothetical protein